MDNTVVKQAHCGLIISLLLTDRQKPRSHSELIPRLRKSAQGSWSLICAHFTCTAADGLQKWAYTEFYVSLGKRVERHTVCRGHMEESSGCYSQSLPYLRMLHSLHAPQLFLRSTMSGKDYVDNPELSGI
jgi:hypothetical protein